MTESVWESWAPEYAPHVQGRYERRQWDAHGMPLLQHIECFCSHCGAAWKTACSTGQVRAHIARFANVHLHKDPFAPTGKP